MRTQLTLNFHLEYHIDILSHHLILTPYFTAGLTNANWKARLEAVQNFSAKVEGLDKTANIQALIQLLGRKPGWKDNNAQVGC